MPAWQALCWLLVAIAIGNGLVAFALALAMRRRVAAAAPPGPLATRPHLVIPATGRLERLEQLRAALLAQQTPPATIAFAVESCADPAFARIAAIFGDGAVPWSITVAGEATRGVQKCRNQAQALRSLPRDASVVLADADIMPQPHWLGHLLRPIEHRRADLVTGYRWPLPDDARLATVLGTWIDRGVAGLTKAAGDRLLWGGSIAIAPRALKVLDLPQVLEPAISDDLALAAAARAHGLRSLVRGTVLVPTPFAHDFRSLFAFGKRQYQIVLVYVPGKWAAALGVTLLNLAGSVAAPALAAASPIGLPAWLALAGVALASAAGRRAQARAAGIQAGWNRAERRLLLLPLVLPLVHLCHLAVILAALDRRTMRWGSYLYRLRGRRVVGIERLAAG